MGFMLESTLLEATCFLFVWFWILYWDITQKFKYWQDRGVPCSKPTFPFGSVKSIVLGRKHVGHMFDDFCKEFRNEPYFGVYEVRQPTLVVKDPELLRRVLTKDFHHFTDRPKPAIDMKKDYLANHLFNMTGNEWRHMRMKLAPTFASGRLKSMLIFMKKCKEQLRDYVESETMKCPEIDVKDTFARFTMNVIATCAFGLEINSLSEKSSKFYNTGVKVVEPPSSVILFIRRFVLMGFPFLSKFYVPTFLPEEVTNFLTNIVRDTVKYREENNVNRNDFLDLLIQVRQNKNLLDGERKNNEPIEKDQYASTDEAGLTIQEMAAQAFIFFAAGYETSSSTMAFCLYELSLNPEIQDKLHQEIREVLAKHEGELTYQALQDMTYMDQVVNETLRRYAPASVLVRTCTEPYKMPDSDLVLHKRQKIVVPVYSIHHDPKNYPDPFKFDPARFAPDKVKERHPYVYIPFGEGPRMCIANRFGLMQTKVGLTEMVSNFQFEISPKTQVPLSLKNSTFVTTPENPVLLHVIKRKQES